MEQIFAALRKEDLPLEKVDQKLIASGFPSAADDYANKKLNLHEYLVGNASSTYFMRVSGSHQEKEGVFDGDLIVIDRAAKVSSGRKVIGVVKGELLIAKIIQEKRDWFFVFAESKVPLSEETFVWGVITYTIHKWS